jgi:glycosyltransferase involved in cell wall biosynthesis
MTTSSELVSVIIPAYNAEETLSETLISVRAQSHRALEIIVVNDGSTDGTLAIAGLHAAEDPRIRIVSQDNGGAAVARNRGIAEARGALIAPVDADDLWRPDKIMRQLAALEKAGPETGLVYTWFAVIDQKSRVVSLSHRPEAEGDVLGAMCRHNIVGNGSSPLFRKDALLEVGGYDVLQPHFCEDLRLYFRIAERFHFAVVRDHLTGYRQSSRSMSNRVMDMLRAYDTVLAEMRPRYPQYEHDFIEARADMVRWLFRKALKGGQLQNAVLLYGAAFKMSSRLAAELVLDEAQGWDESLRSRLRSTFSRNLLNMLAGRPGGYFLGLSCTFYSACALLANAISASSL